MHTVDGDLLESENSGYLLGDGIYVAYNAAMASYNDAHVNEEQPQVKGVDPAGMDLWMRNWCNQHPTKLVADGAGAFIDEMRSNAGQH